MFLHLLTHVYCLLQLEIKNIMHELDENSALTTNFHNLVLIWGKKVVGNETTIINYYMYLEWPYSLMHLKQRSVVVLDPIQRNIQAKKPGHFTN